MQKRKKQRAPLYRIQNKINNDVYYTSPDFPQKTIDGKIFIGVKKTPTDRTLHYIAKDPMVKINER